VLLGGVLLVTAQAAAGVTAAAVAGTRGPTQPAAALPRHLVPGSWPGPGWLVRGPGLRALAPSRGDTNVPQPGVGGDLQGIFCTSPANCWAVGFYVPARGQETELNEVLHWNGSAWSAVSVPNPAGTASGDFNQLFAVRCTASSNCWAVGNAGNPARPLQALHWNGRKWSLVRTPQPAGVAAFGISGLFDVACRSASNCWAVGDYMKGRTELNLAVHWNGRTWSLVRTPQPAGTGADDANALDSVRCISASTCLAVGAAGMITSPFGARNEVLRWNGRTWSSLLVPSPGGNPRTGGFSELIGLACASATSCWAVGDYGHFLTQTFLSQTLHWNGRRWSLVAVPEPGGTGNGANQVLFGVTCSSPANCWAVGDYVPSGGDTLATLNLAVHWNGAAWSLVTTPDPAGFDVGDFNDLVAVRCTSAVNCWAVGQARSLKNGSLAGEALHWDGGIWSAG
jgi:hypothetical protein